MNVIENRKKFFILSLLIILLGFGTMFSNYIAGNGIFNWDVEFTGGTSMEIDLGEEYDVDELEEIVSQVTGQTSPQIQQVLGSNAARIKIQSVDSQTRMNLLNVLWDRYPSAELKESNDISGTVSREMQQAALKATLIAGAVMLLYISVRFRDFRAGSSAIIALIHDVLIVLTAYAVLRIPVNNGFIAVLLTVLGYSVNSTIVIFDRIRENKDKFKPYQLAERMDKSIGQTLSRSIHTSLTTLFAIGAIYVIGVPSIKEFALPMMIGIIAGAYSSICISAPVWYSLMPKKTRELKYDK